MLFGITAVLAGYYGTKALFHNKISDSKILKLKKVINVEPKVMTDSSFQTFDVYDETYGANVTFVVSQNLEKSAKFIRDNQDSTFQVEELYGIDGKTIPRDDKQITIWLYTATYQPLHLGVVSHEIFHATSDILNIVGVPLGYDSNEVYAYEIAYFEREFFKHVKIK